MTEDQKNLGAGQFPLFNRELSWVEFNARVLDEGLQENLPLLERLKFLSIVSSNYDEFFMVRYAALKRLAQKTKGAICPSGITEPELSKRLHKRISELVEKQYGALMNDIFPALREKGLLYVKSGMFSMKQTEYIRNLFLKEIFPILTPVKVPDNGRFPIAGNMRLYAVFELDPLGEKIDGEDIRTAILQIPPNLDRFVMLPDEDGRVCFTLLEEVILANSSLLFTGYVIRDSVLFRVTRDADSGVDEERDEDFLEAMEEVIAGREHSAPVRLQVSAEGSPRLIARLIEMLKLDESEVYRLPGPIALQAFMKLTEITRFDHLRNDEWKPIVPPELAVEENLWDSIRRKDILVHHPYESFDPIVRLVTEASRDPAVLAIKMTLYRTSGTSPIIRALAEAAENGKQVTALVELKARFDEEQNITWANHLERAGVIVVYGIAKLKVHAKALLIVRKEPAGIRRYVHLGTGNYNDKTARLYTDLGMFTAREEIASEISLFFNAITGYSSIPVLRKISMAPTGLRDKIMMLIEREAERASAGETAIIMAKMNALADEKVIRALYKASMKGVEILLNIRGVCMLVPGVKGVSETIHVVSIVDRYLEHSRILYFHNGGDEELYFSSADWMTRNLDHRVELMVPIDDEDLKKRAVGILRLFFRDNVKAHVLGSDGSYLRLSTGKDEPVRAQRVLYEDAVQRISGDKALHGSEFSVRRKPPVVKK